MAPGKTFFFKKKTWVFFSLQRMKINKIVCARVYLFVFVSAYVRVGVHACLCAFVCACLYVRALMYSLHVDMSV